MKVFVFFCALHSNQFQLHSTRPQEKKLKYFIIWLCWSDKKKAKSEESLICLRRSWVFCCYFAVELVRFFYEFVPPFEKCNLKIHFFHSCVLCFVISNFSLILSSSCHTTLDICVQFSWVVRESLHLNWQFIWQSFKTTNFLCLTMIKWYEYV
jgi:hypothetical protein